MRAGWALKEVTADGVKEVAGRRWGEMRAGGGGWGRPERGVERRGTAGGPDLAVSTAKYVVWEQGSLGTGGGHSSRQGRGLLLVCSHDLEGGPRLNWRGSSRATGVRRMPQWGQRGSGVSGIFGVGSPISPQARQRTRRRVLRAAPLIQP